MKPYKYLILLIFGLSFYACDDITDKETGGGETGGSTEETGTAEIYVLSEGLFNMNNSTLAYYSLKNGEKDEDYFRNMNRRGLGDTGNDMALYGNKLYIVVNVSSQIEVIDFPTGASLKQIPMTDDENIPREPRYIAFHKDKAYVCSFDGTVARIDTASLEIDGYATAGRNPDGICVQGDKLYVSNSGGLDWETGVDNTVSVIGTEPFEEIKKIEVGLNPGRIAADAYGYVYVSTRGDAISEGDYNFVQIDTRTNEVARTYNEKVMNFAINDRIAYLYNYNYATKSSQIKVFNLISGTTLRENFITDGTEVSTPYGIFVNPYSGNVYVTDAYSYLVRGDVLCFNPQGKLIYRLANIGQNPNTVVFSDKCSLANSGGSENDPRAAAFANKVLEYRPAPSQFMNTNATAYKEGFTYQQVLEYATEKLLDRNLCLLSLGAFGGSITVGFDHTVPNVTDEFDLKIYGNASYDMYGTNKDQPGGSAEPGIVLVSKDTNGNGLPDDEWYELAGSEYNSPSTIKNYEITYYRPESPKDNIRWTDNQGGNGEIERNEFNTQDSYYPQWIEEDQITFRGNRLADNAVNEVRPDMPEHWVGYCYDWGYADNHPNDTEYTKFKIDWAVDQSGNTVHLDGIDFVKIYTAVNQNCGWAGEISTEIQAVEDLHYKN